MNHAQEECRKRINDKQPCVNNKGQMYWPKINNTTESPNTVQQNSNPMVESIFEPTVFTKEHHDSPHVCSTGHSTIDFEFVYNFNRYVQ